MQSLSDEINNIQIDGEFNENENRIYFYFTNDKNKEDDIYTIIINDKEVSPSLIYLQSNNYNPESYKPNISHYINVNEIDNTGLIDIKVIDIKADLNVQGFGDLDGIYKYIDINQYKHDEDHKVVKVNDKKKIHWAIIRKNDIIEHVSDSELHTLSPSNHIYKSIDGTTKIQNLSISSNIFKLEYGTDYDNYANS